jgi:hypothetical protein
MCLCPQHVRLPINPESSCILTFPSDVDGGGYGQNIGAGVVPSAVPALITNSMYNDEIGFFPLPYGQAQPEMSQFNNWGHFSQIVWKSTTSVGCATVDCSVGGLANIGSGISPWFTVCNYSPAGTSDLTCREYHCTAYPNEQGTLLTSMARTSPSLSVRVWLSFRIGRGTGVKDLEYQLPIGPVKVVHSAGMHQPGNIWCAFVPLRRETGRIGRNVTGAFAHSLLSPRGGKMRWLSGAIDSAARDQGSHKAAQANLQPKVVRPVV